VTGVVQGVGFRPFVYGLAIHLRLKGFVKNSSGRVLIEIEGDSNAIDRFVDTLRYFPPPLARIDHLEVGALAPLGDPGFRIDPSIDDGSEGVLVCPDVATCEDCLRELFDPQDRRYRYPFLNCVNCGPRLTVVTDVPYDRERTTMAKFVMCAACRAEYEDPRDRRFHAQVVACPGCGPRLSLLDAGGAPLATEDPLTWAAAALRNGAIGALKGLGGFHLACDARSEPTVRELRRRKQRDTKPFAIMVADLAGAQALCAVSPLERALLSSVDRSIVVLTRRAGAPVAPSVAPGLHTLGLMLPYTPLHHLLLAETGADALVMTSGNRADEPIACDDDAPAQLRGVADFFLVHDRPIRLRCDDSIVRIAGGGAVPLRRARGHVPQTLTLTHRLARPTLATGGHLKATFALGGRTSAFVSHHVGDLGDYATYRVWLEAIEHYERLFRITPSRIVHDLHPGYASTRYAVERARAGGEELAVQHHHAHMASCMAEHGLEGPVIGVCFDGAGLGTDGTIWGGEFLVGDYLEARRMAHLAPVPMPGGEQAVRQPWRMAVAHVAYAGLDPAASPIARRLDSATLRAVDRMLARRFNAPLTSSMGRLFDAVAALAGVADQTTFEGEAAARLEALAAGVAPEPGYHVPVDRNGLTLVADPASLIRAVVDDARAGVKSAVIARRFHSAVVDLIVTVCSRLRSATGIRIAVLTGGVFANAILAREADQRLFAAGFEVYTHRLVPPNDGGLCLGQLAIAAARDAAAGTAPH